MRDKLLKLPKAALVVIAFFMVAGFLLIMNLAGMLASMILPNKGYMLQGAAEVVVAVYTLGMLFLCGYGSKLKEMGEGFVKGFYIGAFMTVYCFFEGISMFYMEIMKKSEFQPFGMILIYVITMFFIGLNEEVIVRGVVLNLFLDRFENNKKGVVWAVILSSLFFGCAHITNVFSGVPFSSVAIQSVQATLLGVLFAAIYIRSGNLWVCIIIHSAVDFAGLIGSGIFDNGQMTDMLGNLSWINLVVTVPLFLIPCLVLLRKSKLEEVVKLRAGQRVVPSVQEGEAAGAISLAMGIFSIVSGCSGYTMGFGVVGLLGALISKKIKPQENSIATAAAIVSVIGIVFAVIGLFVMVFMLPMISDTGYMDMLNNLY